MSGNIIGSIFLVLLTVVLSSCNPEKQQELPSNNDCPSAIIIESDVRGASMLPIYHDGDIIQYSSGYYECFPVKRGDIVIYHVANDLIIKRVVAIPGDTWTYLSGNIVINGQILKNSIGDVYQINSKMLELYARSYPVIPQDAYMILGNQIEGTLDSSRFGLVAKQDIVGKVLGE